ncbi:hypothetical protein JCM8097_008888 [Rhodosporidiobolus ruineniae]
MSPSSRPLHALIIGGGLAGPCLALSLARHSIRSTIFELRPHITDEGGSISLGPNALKVLDRYASVYDRVKEVGYTYRRFGAYTDDGEKLGNIEVGETKEVGSEGYPAIRVMRTRLHRALFEAAEETKGMVDVKWGANVERIEEGADGVTAYFADGSSAKGDFLVGADGIHSFVRKHILGPAAPAPVFTNTVVVNGFLPRCAAVVPSPDFSFPAFMFTPSGLFMTVPTDPSATQLAWGITRPSVERTREEWRELEISGEAARMAKADFADIEAQPTRSLLDEADETTAKVWAPYSLPDLPIWSKGRVVLIGDAAHAMPPNGHGTAMAFEDAALLTRLLTSAAPPSSTSDFSTLFSRFESLRRPRIDELKEEGKTGNLFKAKAGPWAWWAKKWLFRTFFWAKGGVMRHTEGVGYDVDEVDLEAAAK